MTAASKTRSDSKSTSEKRVAANRRNAQHSTGPRTEEGKAASRLNAVRHGGRCATLELLAGEDAEAYQSLHRSIHASLRPAGDAEAVLVDQYVSVAWKLRRLGDVEAALNDAETRQTSPAEKRDRLLSFGLPAALVDRFANDPQEPPKSIGDLLLKEMRAGKGPRLHLISVEERLRRMLGRTIRELKELRMLRRMFAEDLPNEPIDETVEAPVVEVPAPVEAVEQDVEVESTAETIRAEAPAATTEAETTSATPQAAAGGVDASRELPVARNTSVWPNEPNGVPMGENGHHRDGENREP